MIASAHPLAADAESQGQVLPFAMAFAGNHSARAKGKT